MNKPTEKGMEPTKLERFDLVPNYRCSGVVDEMEHSEDGDWVRYADVEPLIRKIVGYALHKPGCRERKCAWAKRPGEVGVYDCPQCGMWTANLPLYKNDICDKPSPVCTCGLDTLVASLSPAQEGTK